MKAVCKKFGIRADLIVFAVIALTQPDLVIANKEENLKKPIERLRAAGVPVWVTYARTVEEGLKEFRQVPTCG